MNLLTFKTIIITLFLPVLLAGAPSPKWFFSGNGKKPIEIAPGADKRVNVREQFPGSFLLYQEKDRKTLRPDKKFFSSDTLSFIINVKGGPVRGNIFIKDKDGFWFQSVRSFEVSPGSDHKVSVKIPALYGDLQPIGHSAAWSNLYAATVQVIGISVYGSEKGDISLTCSAPLLEGSRPVAKLKVLDWKMPKSTERFKMIQGKFNLSRKYFNPFDPEKITVDMEVEGPDGKSFFIPAFYTLDHVFRYHFTREIMKPVGSPYWEVRLNPQHPGKYRVRLVVRDKTSGKPETIKTDWREIEVKDSDRRGYVRVSKRDKRFFEFDNGDWFFPFGMNIHTNIDRRSERSFKHGRMPDRGIRDYEDYFEAMSRSGMNAAEIWLAAWNCAIEWSSDIRFYHGLGRYNLAHAEKFDRIMDAAKKNGIYIHLTLDNHGKLSASSDQEWYVSPFYSDNEFAVSNGGFLKDPKEFLTNPKALKYNRARNRYIAARWGACTNIFGVELVSEVDLVTGFRTAYEDGTGLKWHQDTIKEFLSFDQGKHLMTSHVCGDYKRNLEYEKMFALPEFDYVVGDAYRNTKIHFVDQMRGQVELLDHFKKPIMITEFGGTSQAGAGSRVVGDIHCGNWSALFKQQAGAPLLWWHDFIHLNDHYKHYAGFNAFIKGIDPRAKKYEYKELEVTGSILPDTLFEHVEMTKKASSANMERQLKRLESADKRLKSAGESLAEKKVLLKKAENSVIDFFGKEMLNRLKALDKAQDAFTRGQKDAGDKELSYLRDKDNKRKSDQEIGKLKKEAETARKKADAAEEKVKKLTANIVPDIEKAALSHKKRFEQEYDIAIENENKIKSELTTQNNRIKEINRNIASNLKKHRLLVKKRDAAKVKFNSAAGRLKAGKAKFHKAQKELAQAEKARSKASSSLNVEQKKLSALRKKESERIFAIANSEGDIAMLQNCVETGGLEADLISKKKSLEKLQKSIVAIISLIKSKTANLAKQKKAERSLRLKTVELAKSKKELEKSSASAKRIWIRYATETRNMERGITDAKNKLASTVETRDSIQKKLTEAAQHRKKAEDELSDLIGGKNRYLIKLGQRLAVKKKLSNYEKKKMDEAKKAKVDAVAAAKAKGVELMDFYLNSGIALRRAADLLNQRGEHKKKVQDSIKEAKQKTDKTSHEIECLSMGGKKEVFGWIFSRSRIYDYPENEAYLKPVKSSSIKLDYKLSPGSYEIVYYNTVTGEKVSAVKFKSEGKNISIPVPDFKIDLAFKVKPLTQNKQKESVKP